MFKECGSWSTWSNFQALSHGTQPQDLLSSPPWRPRKGLTTQIDKRQSWSTSFTQIGERKQTLRRRERERSTRIEAESPGGPRSRSKVWVKSEREETPGGEGGGLGTQRTQTNRDAVVWRKFTVFFISWTNTYVPGLIDSFRLRTVTGLN